jgi:hypothetical protein
VAVAVALLASPSAGARGAADVVIEGAHVEPFAAWVTWKVDRPARVVVEVGAGTEPAIWSRVVTARQAGSYSTTLSPLEPATTYRFRVVATSGSTRSSSEGSLRTAGWPVRAKARVTPGSLKVNTRSVFPRMVWKQCPWAFPASIAAGINVFMGTSCGPPQASMARLAGKALLITDIADRADGPAVIGWHHLDEADAQVDRPEAIPLVPPSSRTGRVPFLTLSSHVWSGASQLPNAAALYPGLVARAEMLGWYVYPLQGLCRKSALAAVYHGQRDLVALARGKPTYQWIEADAMGLCAGLDPSPATIRAQTWLAVAGGARGIGYFPENWKPAVRAEITRLNTELRSLAPALLGPEVPVSVAAPSRVLAGGRTLNGAVYVIAVNPTFARVGARLSVPALGSRQLRVWGEDRTVTVRDGIFTDRFRGLQARVYVAPPPGLG